jgi:hypothetical protein
MRRGDGYQRSSSGISQRAQALLLRQQNIERDNKEIAAFFLFDLLHADPPLAMLECDKDEVYLYR